MMMACAMAMARALLNIVSGITRRSKILLLYSTHHSDLWEHSLIPTALPKDLHLQEEKYN